MKIKKLKNKYKIEFDNRVTKDEIIKVSKKVTLHTVLTLEPKEDEHGED